LNLTLLKAEMRKVWGSPIFELMLGLVFLISLNSVSTLFEIAVQSGLQSKFNTLVAESFVNIMSFQMLPLVLFCGLIVSLSFARDYEQGQMQTLLSLPVSRASLFAVKFAAVVIPLTLVSWGVTAFVVLLNFSTTANNLLVIQSAAWALPITFLAVMFYAGLAVVISLALKRTIPSVLTTLITGFFVSFVTTLRVEVIGDIANYLVFTPYKAPTVALGRVLGMKYPEAGYENALPAWGFLVLIVFYALVFLVPAYLYFTRKFEVKE
jgi:ABC-type transport system involved in multi-copper enzyme maturation permease subunit